MRRTHVFVSALALTLLAVVAARAASPPSLVNYQGVLRDSAGAPLDGSFAMEFHFYDAEVGGNQLLVNQPPPVGVSDGLFNVTLGSGTVADGSGPGTYTSLAEVFRDVEPVYVEILVAGEILSPRVRVLAAPYALNAAKLDGRDASGYLDTSASSQTKSGDLGVGDLDVAGRITIAGGSPGPGKVLTSDAAGLGSWEELPQGPEQARLRDLADRLKTGDPSALPFADLGRFDCSAAGATLSFSIDGVPTGDVAGFVGHDRISTPFEYLVALESSTDIATETQIGKVGRITVQRASGTTTYSGRITEFGLAAMDGANRTYVARLEPRLHRLARSTGYAIFQTSTLPDILGNVLTDAGVTNYTLDLTAGYPPREMVVQYNESDLGFVSRLNEQDGVHYHFREGAAEELLWIADHNGAFPAVAGSFSYYGDMQDPGTGEEYVSTLHRRSRQFTGTGIVRGYDFTNPGLLIEQTATFAGGIGEFYEFFASGVDNALASTRAQQLLDRDQVRRLERAGTSNAPGFRAGHRFALTDTTAGGFGGDYLVTEVTHFALRDPDPACIGYGNAFKAIPAGTTYRPPRVTPKPVVKGPMTAEVTGPSGSEIYTDSYGRIKVQFHWDRVGSSDENSSGWIRVAAPSGGTDDRRYEPRVGTEVVVDFLQGDPDRPIVLGSVYNDDDLPPATDALFLDGGEIRMDQDGPDGDQTIWFHNGGSPTGEFLRWNEAQDRFDLSDDVELSGDLTVGGNDIFFGGGARLLSSSFTTLQTVGDEDTDDLFLLAGNSTDDGALRIFGDSTFELRSGSGLFSLVNGATGVQTAQLDAAGNFQFDGDLTVSGGSVFFPSGSDIEDTSTFFAMRSGNGVFRWIAADTGFLAFLDQTSATINEWKIGGSNLDLFLGDSGADDVFVPGNFSVSGTKNFVQNHPYRDDLSIVYTALEGDEAGTYTRGSARLSGGVARVRLGETFAWVTNPEVGLTAHVTPRGTWADLYVESVTTSELVVRGRDGSDPDAGFDYIVYGLRIGYEDHGVVQRRRMEGRVPAPASYERFYEGNPELRPFSAMERFGRMATETGRPPAAPGPAAQELRAAIGEHDPAIDAAAPDPGDDAPRIPGDSPDPLPDDGARLRPAAPAPLPAVAAAGAPEADADRPGEDGVALSARSLRTAEPELAAVVAVSGDVELGDLLVVDPDDPSRLRPSSREADPAVVGIVSGRPGVLLGGAEANREVEGAPAAGEPGLRAAVAFSGIVLAKVDAGFGAIRVGDLLTSSPTAGHAMRAGDPIPGTVVGKALEPLDSGTALVRVLVMPR